MQNKNFDFSEFLLYIFGTKDWEFVFAGFVFAMLGIGLSYLLQGDSENKEILHKKNQKRFFVSILVVIIALRFSTEFLEGELTMWWAMIFGLASDKLIEIFTKIKSGTSVTEAMGTAFSIKKKNVENINEQP